MAKGNNGNYLQHAVEVDAAVRLAAMHPLNRLHIAFGHGMAPFEPTDVSPTPPARDLLLSALNQSFSGPNPSDSTLVSAYRKTNASLAKYPNSAELLRQTMGADR
ncbi:MAG TPA: hypothetical protein VEC39_08610, partial [Vicinamibacterales bacterium]|nr:hypothetical protein [Vicinamibacterales bacterium]